MSNRVEHQKLNQTTAELSFGWVFVVQLGLRRTQALIKTQTIRSGKMPPAILLFSYKLLLKSNIPGSTFLHLIVLVLISACVCRRLKLDYSCRLISVSSTRKNRVDSRGNVTVNHFSCLPHVLPQMAIFLILRQMHFENKYGLRTCPTHIIYTNKLTFKF